MKSVVMERRTRRIAAGVVSASVILGFVACSGSSERRTSRDDGRGGDYTSEEAGASNGGRNGGGSSSQGGEPTAGSAGAAGTSGSGGGAAGAAGTAAAGGDVGVAGDTGVGGEPSSGGQSYGGENAGGAGGRTAGGEGGGAAGGGGESGAGGVIDPVCGLDMAQVGAYSLWCGKVNMHLTAEGTWTHDTDCTSGCNVAGVGYCQKFYPNATAIVQVDQATSGTKDWKNAGCADSAPDGPGIGGEYACCAPLP